MPHHDAPNQEARPTAANLEESALPGDGWNQSELLMQRAGT
jgi:hypothetical protein